MNDDLLPWHVAARRIIIFMTLLWAALALAFCLPARSQDATPPGWSSSTVPQEKPAPVPLLKSEQAFILDMCQHAAWASQIKFGGMTCETIRQKFDTANKAVTVEKPAPTE